MIPEYFTNNIIFLTSVDVLGRTIIHNTLDVYRTLMVGESSAAASTLYVNEKVGILTESPNVELTVNGKISSNSVIYDEIGNSTQWNSIYSSSNQTSANWDSVYTSVKDTSANWNSVYTTYNTNSASYTTTEYVNNNFLPLSGGTITGNTQFNKDVTIWGILSATGGTYFANTVYSTTSALSVIHVGNGPALYVGQSGTGDIASFYDLDQSIEVFHIGGVNGDYPNVGVKTSTPNVDFTVNGEISASEIIYDKDGNSTQWNSAYLKQTNYLPLSGGTMTGKLNLLPSTVSTVPINLGSGVIPSSTVAGDLFSSGNNIWFKGTSGGPYIFAYKNDTNIFYLPQIISTVSPTGDSIPALRITQTGGGESLRVEDDTNPDSTAFIVNSVGSVGIGLSSMSGISSELTVVGSISATEEIYVNNQKTVKTITTETASLSSVNSIVVVSSLPATQVYGTLYILV